MKLKPQIKIVLFDNDDTLVGTMEAKWAQHKFIANKHYHKSLSDEEIMQHWGKPLSVMAGLLYGTKNDDEAMAHIMESHADFPKKMWDDTLSTLQALKQSGKKIGVVTATRRFSFDTDIEQIGVKHDFFDYIQTEEDTKFHKPDPKVFDPVLIWIDSLGIKPKEVVYVGDGLHDMKAAIGAGFEFIGKTTGLVTQAEFEQSGVISINTLSNLIDL
jgi:HAD superfamily hydrolase (TIGR01549 family)